VEGGGPPCVPAGLGELGLGPEELDLGGGRGRGLADLVGVEVLLGLPVVPAAVATAAMPMTPRLSEVRSSRSFAEVSRYDRCTHTELLHAFGETLLPPDAFTVSPLESARLDATILVVDYVGGDELALVVDVAWTGSGGSARVKDHYQFKSPTFTVNARFNAVSAEAAAHGTVSVGTTNFTPEPARFALLNSIKAGVLEITR
jgi:hypothetical protein